MQQLKYHLTIHSPFRPVEGFLIHFKTHLSEMKDSDKFRPEIEGLLEQIFFTDALLLYSPSQIALAVIVEVAARNGIGNLVEDFVNANLFAGNSSLLSRFWEKKGSIMKMVSELATPSRDVVKGIEARLEKCRNQANNPDSAEFQKSMPSELRNTSTGGDYVSLSQEQNKMELEQIAAHAARKKQ